MSDVVPVSGASCVGAASSSPLTLSSSCVDDSADLNKPPTGLGFPLRIQGQREGKEDSEESHALVEVLLPRSIQLLRDRCDHFVRR